MPNTVLIPVLLGHFHACCASHAYHAYLAVPVPFLSSLSACSAVGAGIAAATIVVAVAAAVVVIAVALIVSVENK
jgi:hypothetical protein